MHPVVAAPRVCRITAAPASCPYLSSHTSSIRNPFVSVPAGDDGEGLPLFVDLVGFTGSGLSRTHHMRDAGNQGGARGAVLATTVSVTEEEKREILMNDFMLIPSADATAEEHALGRTRGAVLGRFTLQNVEHLIACTRLGEFRTR
jgi:hypothetical protein